MNKKFIGIGLASVAVLALAACGNRASKADKDSSDAATVRAAIVTDTGGVDDKSFNQSAWEGLQAWGKEHNYTKDKEFTYFQSNAESEYATNFETAVTNGYNLIYGIGFALKDTVDEAAADHTDINYVLIDEVAKEGLTNVASATFADNEASYLAGVAAAKTTKTKHVGFVGGMEGTVIYRFAAGFKAGVESVDPSIKVTIDYAGSFSDAAKGKTLAAAQYAAGADVIFQAAGGTGAGVFSEAKALNETKDEADKVWVIGVDRDQEAEGTYTSKDGKEANFVLASTLKQVGKVVQDMANKELDGEFPGGTTSVFSLEDGGVDLAETALSEEASKAVAAAKEDILSGKVTVPETVK